MCDAVVNSFSSCALPSINVMSHSFTIYAPQTRMLMQLSSKRAGKERCVVCWPIEVPLSVARVWPLNSARYQEDGGLHAIVWNDKTS